MPSSSSSARSAANRWSSVLPDCPLMLVENLGNRFKSALRESSEFRGDLSIVVDPSAVFEVARYLRDGQGFDYFLYATAVGWPARESRFTLVREERSPTYKTRIRTYTT